MISSFQDGECLGFIFIRTFALLAEAGLFAILDSVPPWLERGETRCAGKRFVKRRAEPPI